MEGQGVTRRHVLRAGTGIWTAGVDAVRGPLCDSRGPIEPAETVGPCRQGPDGARLRA